MIKLMIAGGSFAAVFSLDLNINVVLVCFVNVLSTNVYHKKCCVYHCLPQFTTQFTTHLINSAVNSVVNSGKQCGKQWDPRGTTRRLAPGQPPHPLSGPVSNACAVCGAANPGSLRAPWAPWARWAPYPSISRPIPLHIPPLVCFCLLSVCPKMETRTPLLFMIHLLLRTNGALPYIYIYIYI